MAEQNEGCGCGGCFGTILLICGAYFLGSNMFQEDPATILMIIGLVAIITIIWFTRFLCRIFERFF